VPDNSLWWESDTGVLYVRYNDGDSTQWVIASPMPDPAVYIQKTGDTMTGPLTLAADPTTALQAATKQYSDLKVQKTGDTMTGPLILNADPTAVLGAATKQYSDAGVNTAYNTAVAANNNANTKVAKSGDTMTGNLTAPNFVVGGGGTVVSLVSIELGTPAAANVSYIDFHSSGTGSDYDARIISNGGSSTVGKATLTYTASTHTINGQLNVTGDAYVWRPAAPTTGVVFLNSSGSAYLYFDGTRYTLAGAPLTCAAPANNADVATVQWVINNNYVSNGRLVYAGDVNTTNSNSAPYEPYGGAVMSGWYYNPNTKQTEMFRMRYMQLYTTSWFTVGYA
jgi:hypothetical protein